jgi:hypothetical protein
MGFLVFYLKITKEENNMPIPLIMAGLSLLPKLPSIWEGVAGLFGKKVPGSIQEAGKLAGDVINSLKAGEVSPEIQVEMEKIMKEHEQEMAKITLEEHKLIAEGLSASQNLEAQAYKSHDEYVRRTRPMILRKLFYTCIGYVFFAPGIVVAAAVLGVEAAILTVLVSMVEWVGGWLFSTFGAAYLGYAGARSLDKRNPELKNGNNLIGSAMKYILK